MRQLPDDVQYRVVARGEGAEPAGDAAALADYFNLSHSLAALAPGWRSACARFAAVHPLLPGARMLRQDPVECLFQVGMGMEEKGGRRFDGLAETLSGQYGPGKLEGKQRRRQAERLRWFLVCLFQVGMGMEGWMLGLPLRQFGPQRGGAGQAERVLKSGCCWLL